jgi:predicted Zn finger-like uncharacterized protein
MLYTRCPNCRTTFRITVETLHKADGQARCGRCACVFNAFEQLLEEVPPQDRLLPAEPPVSDPVVREAASEAQDDAYGSGAAGDDLDDGDIDPDTIDSSQQRARSAAPERAAVDQPSPHATRQPPADTDEGRSQRDTDEAFESSEIIAPWSIVAPADSSVKSVTLWRVAVLIAVLALPTQAVHHFRADLVRSELVGPRLQSIYTSVGRPIQPAWDPNEYNIVRWETTAEPSSDGQPDSLLFTATIANRSDSSAAYPIVQLTLTNRWQEIVGSRYFQPEEYLSAEESRPSLMPPGARAEARLALVDPGPDAYGFEVDVCVEVEEEQLSCKADRVFE